MVKINLTVYKEMRIHLPKLHTIC